MIARNSAMQREGSTSRRLPKSKQEGAPGIYSCRTGRLATAVASRQRMDERAGRRLRAGPQQQPFSSPRRRKQERGGLGVRFGEDAPRIRKKNGPANVGARGRSAVRGGRTSDRNACAKSESRPAGTIPAAKNASDLDAMALAATLRVGLLMSPSYVNLR